MRPVPAARPAVTAPAAALVLMLLAAAHPAAAQTARGFRRADAPTPAAAPLAPADPSAVALPRAVLAFDLRGVLPDGFPSHVAVTDSAGRLGARYRMRGVGTERPMEVTLLGEDVVLQAYTPDGEVVTLQLVGQNDNPAPALAGRWWLGAQHGTLRGRARR